MMDFVDARALKSNKSPIEEKDLEFCRASGEIKKWPKTPFPINIDINNRVVLYNGELELICADAVVNPTNENLTQLGVLAKLAGPGLEAYLLNKARLCATGDVRLTPGFQSNFKYILHAVPPKYQPKYKTAAETALFHTYFRILETMIDRKIRTIVIPILVTSKCNLPVEENYQMQLRVIRRFLEKKKHEIDKVIVHVPSGGEAFEKPFFYYFPQTSLDEELACYYLSALIGGSNGEPVIPEREIRIKSKPAIFGLNDRSIDLTSGLDLSTVVGKTAFSKMRDDLDRQPPASNQVVIRKSMFRGCTLL